ncbi:MAG: PIN domain-containing protein [Longimicrobiales bacterium]
MRALVDTSALLALSHARDQHHARAVEMAARHRAAGGTYVGTTLVLSEFYSHLLYLRDAAVARTALRHLLDDPIQSWVEVGPELVGEASSRWLARYDDQAFSLVDAVSFEVMRTENVAAAFAFDHHFEVAGFELLR